MLDNGAFSAWKRGYAPQWEAYYAWCDEWLNHPTTWAVIPDEIDAGWQAQDALLRQWPHGHRGAPVYHMDEAIARLHTLIDAGWPRVCVGSTAEYAAVMSPPWTRRMDEIWNSLTRAYGRAPHLHMLRGMQLSGGPYPFASLDSTDIAQNHHLPHKGPRSMADRWDASQCAMLWHIRATQEELL